MKDVMKIRIVVPALLLTMASISYGQAVPAGGNNTPISAIGSTPFLPSLDGVLHYALNGSEIFQYGYYGAGNTTYSTALSGDVGYTAKSVVFPFTMLFAGGVILGNQQGQGTLSYWNLAATQGYVTRNWVFNISDSFNFLPQSPTTGLSGIPGVGDLGSSPLEGPVTGPAGGIFSFAGDRIGNSLAGSAERQISPQMSISGTGSWSILHFLGDDANALNDSWVSGSVALNRRLDGRSSASIAAVYSTITYSGNESGPATPDIETKGINVSYQRLLSRRLSVSLTAGPQWISSANSTYIPSSLNAYGSASLTYSLGLTSAGVSYSHGVNGGSGVLPGAISDTISGSLRHTFGRKWVAALTGGYVRSAGLTELFNNVSTPVNEVYDSTYGGAQVTRAFSTHFSGFASFSVQNQVSNYSLAGYNALNGTSETFGIGISYTPRSTRLGQF
jgi:hypothetical protein